MFIHIAIFSSFENSEIAEYECVYLCDSLISAALGLSKRCKEGKWFSMKYKTLNCYVSHSVKRMLLPKYLIGDPEPLIHRNSSGDWYVYLLPPQLSSRLEGKNA